MQSHNSFSISVPVKIFYSKAIDLDAFGYDKIRFICYHDELSH